MPHRIDKVESDERARCDRREEARELEHRRQVVARSPTKLNRAPSLGVLLNAEYPASEQIRLGMLAEERGYPVAPLA